MHSTEPMRLFFCGDVMTGRGVDQAFACPSDPALHEPYVRDARRYVELAEQRNGPIPRPVGPAYVWGDALAELERARADLRIINLETSITTSGHYWRGKEIHYRMHPRNVDCITAALIDCCCLANNHILDWGYEGLLETLRTLDLAGVAHAGAGRDASEARAPAVLSAPGNGRLLVFSYGLPSSGVPPEWAAGRDRPGVNFLEDTSERSLQRVVDDMRQHAHAGDVIAVSIHWGVNWGYAVSDEEIRFAHRLVEEGADVVHGHSSHHVKMAEMYQDRLVLYGCGDFLNDYEGIGGYEEYRNDLALMYLAEVDPRTGGLVQARMLPMRMARFQLHRAAGRDAEWLRDLLSQLGAPFGSTVDLAADESLILRETHR